MRRLVIFLAVDVVVTIVIYLLAYFNWLLNKVHITQLIQAGIQPSFNDSILLGYGTFQWWAVLIVVVAGLLITASFFAGIDSSR
jgi:hypothetical protein